MSHLTDAERVDALLKMQAAARERFRGHVAVEWRMNFGIWGALLAISAGLASKDYSLSSDTRWAVVVGVLVVIVVHGVWCVRITRLLADDRWLAWTFAEKAEWIVCKEPVIVDGKPRPPRPADGWFDWGTRTGLWITVLLGVLVILVAQP